MPPVQEKREEEEEGREGSRGSREYAIMAERIINMSTFFLAPCLSASPLDRDRSRRQEQKTGAGLGAPEDRLEQETSQRDDCEHETHGGGKHAQLPAYLMAEESWRKSQTP